MTGIWKRNLIPDSIFLSLGLIFLSYFTFRFLAMLSCTNYLNFLFFAGGGGERGHKAKLYIQKELAYFL